MNASVFSIHKITIKTRKVKMAKGQMSSKQLMKETARVGCDVSTVTAARPYRRTATAWPGTGATTASTASTATAGWSARNVR